jgi:hypothetical protein
MRLTSTALVILALLLCWSGTPTFADESFRSLQVEIIPGTPPWPEDQDICMARSLNGKEIIATFTVSPSYPGPTNKSIDVGPRIVGPSYTRIYAWLKGAFPYHTCLKKSSQYR